MKFARNGTIVTAATITNALSSFIGIVILTRIVPQQELGIYFLFEATLGLLSIPAAAGINGAIEKRISQGENAEQILGTALVIKTTILMALSAVLFVTRDIIQEYIGIPILLALIAGLALQEIARIGFRTLRGEKRVAVASLLQSARSVVWIISAVVAGLNGAGARGLINSLLISYLVMAVIGLVLQNTTIGSFSVTSFYSIFDYARYNIVTSVGGTIYGWMDTAMLGIFVSPNLIAAYEVSWRISKIGLVVSRAVALTTFPQISEWAAQEQYQKITETISNSIVPSLLVVIPAFFGVLILSQDLLTQIYGAEYAIAGSALMILSLERVIKAGTQIFSRALHALDRPDLSARATVLAIGANIPLNWIFIQSYGIVGAAVATSISFSLKFIFEWWSLQGLVTIQVPYKAIMSICISSLVMTGILILVKELIPPAELASLIALVLGGAICYLIVLSLFPKMRDRMSILLNQINSGL